MAWDFQVESANLYMNPLIYLHVLNVVECFSRPLASSGDAFKLKQGERKHIFKNAAKIELVKKKGNTLRFWHDYVAVLSGSYIYFYSADKLE